MPVSSLRHAFPSSAFCERGASAARSSSFWLARARQITMRDGSTSLYTGRYGFLTPVFSSPAWA